MNKYALCGLSAVLGAAAGVAGTYVFMKKKCEEEIQSEIDKYKVSVREAEKKHALETAGEPSEVPVKKTEESILDSKSSISGGPVSIEKRQYHKMNASYMKSMADLEANRVEEEITSDEEAGKSAEDVLAEGESPSEDDGFSIISYEKYEELTGIDDYADIALLWYIEDDRVFNDTMEEIANREALIGDVLSDMRDELISNTENDGALVYVLNEADKECYAVEIIFGSEED